MLCSTMPGILQKLHSLELRKNVTQACFLSLEEKSSPEK